MRCQRSILGCVIIFGLNARHMAGLAGGYRILLVERQWRLPRPGGLMPFVVNRKCAEPLVSIHLLRNRCFVASPTKFGRAIEVAHHRPLVQVNIAQDLVLRWQALAWGSIWVEH